jgi:hypothetical protein
MSKTHETLTTICEGALGGISFGAYHHYTTNKMMELNNEKIKIQQKCFMDKMENNHKTDMIEMENNHKTDMIEMVNKQKILNDKLDKLEKALSNKIELTNEPETI